MCLVDSLVNEWVFKHMSSCQPDEQVACHIIGQVSHDSGTLASLLYCCTLYFQKVEISIDVHLATFIVKHVRCRYQLAVSMIEMEESLQIVYIWRREEIRRPKFDTEPIRYGQALISECPLCWVFVNSHMDTKSCWVEIEHNVLLLESKCCM